jgi:hypothetical protein
MGYALSLAKASSYISPALISMILPLNFLNISSSSVCSSVVQCLSTQVQAVAVAGMLHEEDVVDGPVHS